MTTIAAFALLLCLDASSGFVAVKQRVVLQSPRRHLPPSRALVPSAPVVVDLVVNEPVVRDTLCSLVSVTGAIAWLKIWTTLASNGSMDSRLSRKIIHCGSAPLFLLLWPFFSSSPQARLVAAIVPALNMAKLALAAKAKDPESTNLVTAVSRSGEAREVLGGPLLYCAVLLLATLFGWRASVAAIVAICQMAVGSVPALIETLLSHRWATDSPTSSADATESNTSGRETLYFCTIITFMPQVCTEQVNFYPFD